MIAIMINNSKNKKTSERYKQFSALVYDYGLWFIYILENCCINLTLCELINVVDVSVCWEMYTCQFLKYKYLCFWYAKHGKWDNDFRWRCFVSFLLWKSKVIEKIRNPDKRRCECRKCNDKLDEDTY